MLVQAKSPAVYKGRVTASIVLLLLGVGFAFLYRYAGINAVRQVVQSIGFVIIMICVFSGVSVTADTISREKREGTLGLLFLTPLTAAEIGLGKLIAGGLTLFYALLIGLPLFSLIVIAGGVGWREVLGVMLLASNVAFASAAIGLFTSAISFERKKAQGRGIWIVLFFWWLLPAAAEGIARTQAPGWISALLRTLAFNSFFGNPAAMARGSFLPSWVNILCTHLIGWLFIAAAIYHLPRRWQEHSATPKRTLREWWRQFCLGSGEPRYRRRFKLLNKNPFLWLASRDRTRVWHAWITTVLMLGFLFFVRAGVTHSLLISVLGASLVLQFMWAGAATAQLLAEQEQGTMEMLLSTPLSPREIMRGQLMALVRQFSGPFTLVFGLQWLAAIFLFLSEGELALSLGVVILSFLCSFNLYVLYHLGMWSAVTVKDPKHASGAAIGQCFFIPVLILTLIMAGIGFLNWMGLMRLNPQPRHVIGTWLAIQCASNIFWLVVVRKSLPQKMRAWAMQRYTAEPQKPSWMSRLFRSAKTAAH
jgi:ABC-type transport system involved in multi-copper enzyme maturation permease subunit